jgi:hypothetical protein
VFLAGETGWSKKEILSMKPKELHDYLKAAYKLYRRKNTPTK